MQETAAKMHGVNAPKISPEQAKIAADRMASHNASAQGQGQSCGLVTCAFSVP